MSQRACLGGASGRLQFQRSGTDNHGKKTTAAYRRYLVLTKLCQTAPLAHVSDRSGPLKVCHWAHWPGMHGTIVDQSSGYDFCPVGHILPRIGRLDLIVERFGTILLKPNTYGMVHEGEVYKVT